MSYVKKNLREVDDAAPGAGFGDMGEARFATEALEAEGAGFSYHRLNPGKRQPFGHVHEAAEEVYVVLSGSGRVKLDDDIVDIAALDAIRVEPKVKRAFESGPDGLEVLVFGPRHKGDGEVLPNWWSD